MLKTGLAQRYLRYTYAVKYLIHYPTVSHSRLPICSITTPPKQQMNKMSSVASVPHSTATMRNTCLCKIILPGTLRVYRQVRNENYRSVRKLDLAAFEQCRHSQRKNTATDPLYCDARLAIPAQSQ